MGVVQGIKDSNFPKRGYSGEFGKFLPKFLEPFEIVGGKLSVKPNGSWYFKEGETLLVTENINTPADLVLAATCLVRMCENGYSSVFVNPRETALRTGIIGDANTKVIFTALVDGILNGTIPVAGISTVTLNKFQMIATLLGKK